MHNFLRALRLALQYRLTLLGVVLCSIAVALFWGANIGAVYPLVEVVFQGKSVPRWLDDEIAASGEKVTHLETRVAEHEAKLAALPADERPAARQSLVRLRSSLDSEQRLLDRLLGAKPFVDRHLPVEPFQTLVLIVVLLLLGTMIKVVFLVGNLILVERLAQLATYDLRKQFYRRTLRMDLGAFGEDRSAGLIARFTNDMNAITHGVSIVVGKLLREPLKMVVFLGCAAWICWRLLLLSLIVSPIIIFLVSRLAKSIKRANRRAMEDMASLYSHLSETFSSIQVVKAYTTEAYERNRFHLTAKQYFVRSMKIAAYTALTKPATELLGLTVISLAILAGGYLVLTQETELLGIRMCNRPLDFGAIMAFFGFLVAMTDPARKMTEVFGMLQQALAASDRVYEMMDREPKIIDAAQPRQVPEPPFDLVFDHISFGYEPGQKVLDDLSLTIPYGHTLAIVGPNGCGKTTLIKLIPRFYDPDSGTVRLNNVPVTDLRLKDLRSQIGLVTQQTMLFDDTVMSNIRYGSPNATDGEVVEAARKAHAHGFITNKLSCGYETIVGEGGGKLSGGQRQRIALARAILRDPRILILDEATSQIDPKSEQLIHQVLEKFKQGRTTIMVTHRLSTLALADQILVMDGGQILDLGNHEQLAARCPVYQRLYQVELRESA